jgi:hypothetical protein
MRVDPIDMLKVLDKTGHNDIQSMLRSAVDVYIDVIETAQQNKQEWS